MDDEIAEAGSARQLGGERVGDSAGAGEQREGFSRARRAAELFVHANVRGEVDATLNRLLQVHEQDVPQILVRPEARRVDVTTCAESRDVMQNVSCSLLEDLAVNHRWRPVELRATPDEHVARTPSR